ncbi:MAG: hypothetical protein HRT38_17525 [Alteromonadaceae bacterium]|nr:hypothetical protein [Alteromonadaceae bacterium]
MRKLLSSPVKMALTETENVIYQNALKYASELSLNLMAVKVTNRPEDFLNWCSELIRLCRQELNIELLDPEQLLPLSKLQTVLESGVSSTQLKMARIAPWPIFVDFIQKQKTIHALEERFKLLDYINEIKVKPLAELIEEDRLAFAGKHTNNHDHSVYNFDVEWFASTKGAKVFHLLLQQKPADFDQALSYIPLEGDVTPEQYENFSKAYQHIFSSHTDEKPSGEKAPLAAATRLLAMRRPDQFIALTNAKIDILCQGFSIPKFNNFDFNSYWQDMIGTLRTFAWWHQAEPTQANELKIWQARAILVDLFLFADENTAQNSNYFRLRDKTQKNNGRATAGSVARKRTKESAEMLVDRALTADDIPEYLLNKRDSIINEVKNGKSVEHVIRLMRAIFG